MLLFQNIKQNCLNLNTFPHFANFLKTEIFPKMKKPQFLEKYKKKIKTFTYVSDRRSFSIVSNFKKNLKAVSLNEDIIVKN